jgi:glycosyltransferase involved in cell wall biosynthesis
MSLSQVVKPRLVILLSRFPYPLEKGDKLRAYHQIVGLSNDFEITLICITEKKVDSKHESVLKKYCKEIYIFKLNKLLQIIYLLLSLFTEKPFQIGYFWQYHIHLKIKKIINNLTPDYIYTQLIRTTEYVKNYHVCPKILDYMDVFSKGIERRIESQPFLLKPFFKSEYQRLKKYEKYIFDYFEEHTIISKQDRSFINHSKSEEIVIIKNGISEDFFQVKNLTKKFDFVFTGNMSYPPNISACQYIVNEILPILDKKYTVLISGVNPSKSVLKLQSNNINITGWVNNIKESYLSSSVFLAPMFIGTGLQNKLLEAMALGIPCITTSLANNALGANPDEMILIANSKEEFKYQIERLISDQELYSRIQTNARNFVRKNYSWNPINKQLADLIVNSKNKMMN